MGICTIPGFSQLKLKTGCQYATIVELDVLQLVNVVSRTDTISKSPMQLQQEFVDIKEVDVRLNKGCDFMAGSSSDHGHSIKCQEL